MSENRLFSFCVGVGVGGHDATNFSYMSKDEQENSKSFDVNFTGVEIAWVEFISHKSVGLTSSTCWKCNFRHFRAF